MKKKLLSMLLCLVLVVSVVCVLAACIAPGENGDGDVTKYDITVWVGEGTKELTERQIAKFNETNNYKVKFNATVNIVSESKAVGDAVSKPADCADIFCFAQDQLARAVTGGLLATLGTTSVATIEANNDADSIEAAKIGGTVRAFPMTADNGYFMYYDKRVIDESHVGSLEALLADCEAAGKNFSMNINSDGAWYAASFFYATGCKSEWITDDNGNFVNYNDTFNSAEGRIALQGLQKLLKSNAHQDSDKVADFSAAVPSAVVISGIWDYKAAKTALGDNLGIAPLPSFTVGDQSYQLVSYLGRKLMGIKPQSDALKAAYLQRLAEYLTSDTCQLERFEEMGWGPSNKVAQTNSAVVNNVALSILANSKTVLQGQYPTEWWAHVEVMTGSAKTSNSETATLDAMLSLYNSGLSDFLFK